MLRRTATLFLFALGPVLAQAQEATDARQIHWQRTLDDGLAVAKATGRPLLLAVNMDGESASDRIVHEQYRDPAFVQLTRRCVCLGASVFRHNARDHDDQGRRIPCPRFGDITCGEHIALEPVLWDRYLSDGERVAPRHALVMADGKKAFDLSLCFDLKDIDRALAAAVAPGGPDRSIERANQTAPPMPDPLALTGSESWAELAARRDSAGRAALERALAGTDEPAALLAALAAIAEHGDGGSITIELMGQAGSFEALRLLAARLPALPADVVAALRTTIDELGVKRATSPFPPGMAGVDAHPEPGFAMLRAVGQDLGEVVGDPGPDRRQQALARLMGSLRGVAAVAKPEDESGPSIPIDPGQAVYGAKGTQPTASSLRSHLLALAAVGLGNEPAVDAVDIGRILQTAAAVAAQTASLPQTGGPSDTMPAADELQQQLQRFDAEPKAARDRPEWQAAYAKASLDLGRHRLAAGARDAQILLEDAALHFEKALSAAPEHYEWWIERARAEYFLQRFEAEVQYGQKALQLALGGKELPADAALLGSAVLQDARAIEALRWIGDGHARLLVQRAGGKDERAGMVRGLRALGIVAASPFGSDQDWVGFASFAGAIGLWRVEQAIAMAGAMRYPASRELRQLLNVALWNCGRPDLSGSVAEQIERGHAPSADASWFCGYAWILVGEDARRTERPAAAIAAYATAQRWFARAAGQNEAYGDNCRWFAAVAEVGTAMAHLQGRRDAAAAAACLQRALASKHDLTQLRDGLGYDLLDVVDKLVEWRGDGTAGVPPMQLLDQIDAQVADEPYWAVAVSDSALREALRADGRNPQRAMKQTVDAGGNPITMPMGLPTEAGDAWLQASIDAGRRAVQRAKTDQDKQPLLQSLTVFAERQFERGRLDGVQAALAEAAPLAGMQAPAADADEAALRALAGKLRSQLGPARPRLREGR